MESPEALLGVDPSRRVVDEWALVLASQGVRSRVAGTGQGWGLWVAADDLARAGPALADWARENQPAPPPPRHPVWEGQGPTVATLLVVSSFLLFHVVTGPAAADSHWFERGAATARIVSDEPWRAVTALCLHADQGHALANAAAGGLFLSLWLRVLGPGVGLLLVLAAGALGNGLNAGLQSLGHVSVGASTAVFGTVGLLAGSAALRREGRPVRRHPAWVMAAAGLALLGMLGTGGERTDLWAHAFGLLAGGLLGAGAAAVWSRPPAPLLQLVCGALFVVAIVAAWGAAA
ncbi:MAG: rhomboid family intramembrane serine protease [Myxococcota bacterium]|nr:rhomboid family intramembrane serine protease [Myxococcota bacterium]